MSSTVDFFCCCDDASGAAGVGLVVLEEEPNISARRSWLD